ncbi:MAG: CRISPR-associated protein Cas4 [Oscillospiraceae bacterium]|nr:CRISPR-associated protein Cas4 [Oscillospiraceae bacterium]
MYDEDDHLMLSGIQHFAFCRRQWALIDIEQQWEDNYRTADGDIMHERVHDASVREKRGDLIVTRAMAVSSSRLGLSGECDAVEFRRDPDGVPIHGMDGTWSVTPVEYKRGRPKDDDCDILQLTAQAMCLEDMLCCEIREGYLYYGETRHRMKVVFDEQLRKRTEDIIEEMHELYRKKHTPIVKRRKACNACSLKEICLPQTEKKKASVYIRDTLYGDGAS